MPVKPGASGRPCWCQSFCSGQPRKQTDSFSYKLRGFNICLDYAAINASQLLRLKIVLDKLMDRLIFVFNDLSSGHSESPINCLTGMIHQPGDTGVGCL